MKNKTLAAVSGIVIVMLAVIIIFFVAHRNAESPTPVAVVNPVHASISVSNVLTGQNLQLPFTVMGQVKGNWFFEGSFPVGMEDANHNGLGQGLAHSTQNWMTANTIPFTVALPAVNYQGPGFIVFTKDNPSGEPQFDDSYTLPVNFQ